MCKPVSRLAINQEQGYGKTSLKPGAYRNAEVKAVPDEELRHT
jgi:hypothetical protein